VLDHYGIPSDATPRSWQLGRIKPKLFTRAAHHALIEDLTRGAERHFCLSSLSVHCDYHGALMPPLMFAVIDATALLDEPFSECAAFHLHDR